ncbi:MAG: hypothetical protein P4L46_21535 [Fimbriimonas sp.]|nr:hypothetical protein [Fimbriimonas sp.]
MKWTSTRYVLPVLILATVAIGCKSNPLNDQIQGEKQVIDKDKAKVDDRSNAIDKLNSQAASPGTSSPN